MAFTKPEFYVSVALLVGLVLTGVISCGNALLSNPNITLDSESIIYVAAITGQEASTGFEAIRLTNTSGLKIEDLVGDTSDIGTPSTTDQLAVTNYFKNKADKKQNYFKLIYNVPSTIIMGLGLPLEPFKDVLNILLYSLTVLLGLMFWLKVIK